LLSIINDWDNPKKGIDKGKVAEDLLSFEQYKDQRIRKITFILRFIAYIDNGMYEETEKILADLPDHITDVELETLAASCMHRKWPKKDIAIELTLAGIKWRLHENGTNFLSKDEATLLLLRFRRCVLLADNLETEMAMYVKVLALVNGLKLQEQVASEIGEWFVTYSWNCGVVQYNYNDTLTSLHDSESWFSMSLRIGAAFGIDKYYKEKLEKMTTIQSMVQDKIVDLSK